MKLALSIVIAGILSLLAAPSWAEEDFNPAAMAKALQQPSLPLEKGLKVSEREGKPVSAKYEIEHGALQLSLYTMKGDKFSELIIDHKSGAVAKEEVITDADDLKAAQAQAAAMTKTRATLDVPIAKALKDNAGYRAVSVMPKLEGVRPGAVVTLLTAEDVKPVTEKLERSSTPAPHASLASISPEDPNETRDDNRGRTRDA